MARLLLGVTGGIAAYKAVEIVRLATAAGHAVRVIQTPASLKFVGRATFEGVTGAPVLVDEFEPDPARGAFPGDPAPGHAAISHLELVRRCDAYAIAPASANTLAKLAGGHADNLLTSAALASTKPLVLAPAMNNHMWEHPATRGNVETLRLRGATIVEPGTGRLASEGEWGAGRLAEAAEVLAEIERALTGGRFAPRSLDGVRVLVTAGGTREPVDPVRFLGNRSSGKQGYAVAQLAAARGARVHLIAAATALPDPAGVEVSRVETALQLQAGVEAAAARADVVVMAAAVADFRPAAYADTKIKKAHGAGRDEEAPTVTLTRNPDILAGLVAERGAARHPVIVGFAAETGDAEGDVLHHARVKLARKGCDLLVANEVGADVTFGRDSSTVHLLRPGRDEARTVGPATKTVTAGALWDEVVQILAQDPDRSG